MFFFREIERVNDHAEEKAFRVVGAEIKGAGQAENQRDRAADAFFPVQQSSQLNKSVKSKQKEKIGKDQSDEQVNAFGLETFRQPEGQGANQIRVKREKRDVAVTRRQVFGSDISPLCDGKLPFAVPSAPDINEPFRGKEKTLIDVPLIVPVRGKIGGEPGNDRQNEAAPAKKTENILPVFFVVKKSFYALNPVHAVIIILSPYGKRNNGRCIIIDDLTI